MKKLKLANVLKPRKPKVLKKSNPIGLSVEELNLLSKENYILKDKINIRDDLLLDHDLRKILYGRFEVATNCKSDRDYKFQERIKRLPLTKKIFEEMIYRHENNIKFKKIKILTTKLIEFVKTEVEAIDCVKFKSNILYKEQISLDLVLYFRLIENVCSNSYKSIYQKFGTNEFNFALLRKKGKINVTLDLKDKNLVLIVQDNGMGVPSKILNELKNGVRTTTKTTDVKLHGLGFLSARKCVEYHNGTIEIDSKEGKGTKIVVSIPVK